MKEKLLSWFFKKEIHNIHLRHKYEKKKMSSEILELKEKLKQANYSIPKRAFNMFPNCVIMGITTNPKNLKNPDEEVYVLKTTYNSQISIYLMSESYLAINTLPRIYAYIKTDLTNENYHNYIFIEDIITVDNSVGNGEIIMDYFLKTARDLNVKYVSGNLAYADHDHFDRLKDYYEKFKFKVIINEDKNSGLIKKFL